MHDRDDRLSPKLLHPGGQMQHVAIIYKRSRPEAARLAGDLRAWFENRNIEVFCEENIDSAGVICDYHKIDFPQNIEAVVVIGGDGTFLSVARFVEQRNIPIVGVNLGGLGFLTEVTKDTCYEHMERVLAGDYTIEERMRLKVSIMRRGKEIFNHRVLNDIVINKGALARILDLEATIDGRFLTHYRADGLIIATPTGSTAYNISAGGPIVYPTSSAIILTPICSFNLSDRSIILPPDVTIRVGLVCEEPDVTLTADGQVGCLIEKPDAIVVKMAAAPVRIINTPDIDHLKTLRTKLQWGQD
jgi:NAD+ kinase